MFKIKNIFSSVKELSDFINSRDSNFIAALVVCKEISPTPIWVSKGKDKEHLLVRGFMGEIDV